MIAWFAVTLEQVYPEVGTPVCLGDKVAYRCTAVTSQLIWTYSGQGGSLYDFVYTGMDDSNIGVRFPLGTFEVVLESVTSQGSNVVLTSNATSINGLTADDDGQELSCVGVTFKTITISVTS